MLLRLILLAIAANIVQGQEISCDTTDSTGPDNLVKLGQKYNSATLAVEKNGRFRYMSADVNTMRLTLDRSVGFKKTKFGIFLENNNITGLYAIYATNGAETCRYLKDKNHTVLCPKYSHRFQGLTDFAEDRNISRIVGTQLTHREFLFSIYATNKYQQVDNYQVLINDSGFLKQARKLSNMPATTLMRLKHSNEQYDILVVGFGEMVGQYNYSSSENTELIISRAINYRSTRPWLGCPPDICFDGRIDGATTVDSKGTIHLFRSLYQVDSNFKLSPHPFELDSIERIIPLNSSYPQYYLTTFVNMCTLGQNGNIKVACTRLFGNLSMFANKYTIDAIFALPKKNRVYLVFDNLYATYLENNHTFVYYDDGILIDLWPDLPQTIDGATVVGDRVLFFQDNFVYNVRISDLGQDVSTFNVSLLQEIFVNGNCDDQYYKKSASSQLLNVSTFEEFKEYRMQFETIAPKTEKPTTIKPKTSSTLRTSSRQATSTTVKKPYLGYLLGIVVILCFIFLIFCCCVKKTVEKVDGAPRLIGNTDILTVTNTVQPTVSAESMTYTI
ncbi:hypothetical protein HDE_01573 [Halotydeus destructor]|nr:hypothetical protein HDE_01573 [Halotydeus destructor]